MYGTFPTQPTRRWIERPSFRVDSNFGPITNDTLRARLRKSSMDLPRSSSLYLGRRTNKNFGLNSREKSLCRALRTFTATTDAKMNANSRKGIMRINENSTDYSRRLKTKHGTYHNSGVRLYNSGRFCGKCGGIRY